MPNPFYITTPIYYVNAKPHLGHAYTSIVVDVACRFHSMKKADTFFQTGTDEHGDKIERAAKTAGVTPKAYADKISGLFRSLWPDLNIKYDSFVRTTDVSHMLFVKDILQKIYDAGDIYFHEYEGMYCFGCERFYMERELVDGKCPDHETKPEIIRESNYFFKMSNYQEWLIDYIKSNPDFIRPERYKNEILAFLKEPLEDLCISRPKKRLQWGITLPFDNEYVTYVWFDALLNYISTLGYPDGDLYKRLWPFAQHVVAKDIIKPHGIYWPIMLKAAKIPLYKHLNVHGYWNIEQSKMSKSLGNVVSPLDLKNKYGLDAFRYFLMRDMVFGLDSNFSEEALIQRINSDLANDLGNLFSRSLAMAHKYLDGKVPDLDPEAEKKIKFDIEPDSKAVIAGFEKNMTLFAFHKALMEIWKFIKKLNKYIDITAPWELAKKQSNQKHLEAVIYNLLEGLRIISGLIYPVMPDTASTMQKHLGLDPEKEFYLLDTLKTWGLTKPGTEIPKSISLFPRVEIKKKKEPQVKEAVETKTQISFEDFSKVDLRVATIIKAEAIPKAKKLLKLEVDIGEKRTIVAGIAKSYSPDDLIGKQVIIVANLKPTKLMGVLSNGMLLAAVDKDDCSISALDGTVTPGTLVS